MKYARLCIPISTAILVVFLAAIVSGRDMGSPDSAEPSLSSRPLVGTHPVLDFDREGFFDSVARSADPFPLGLSGSLRGGIIPHHTLPGFLIARFFRTVAAGPSIPKKIILIGPNHPDAGARTVLTSSFDWETPFGRVRAAREEVAAITASESAFENGDILSREHSVAAIMPYVKYFLPDTEVIPIVLQSKLDSADVKRIAKDLSAFVDEGTIVVAAVDFSHYLTASQAQKKDEHTRLLLESLSAEGLFGLDNDHLDSPASIALLFEMMMVEGVSDFRILANTNSGFLSDDFVTPTTSYFVAGFLR